MTLAFELAGSQIDGARDYQEDAFLITNLTDATGQPSALVVVADGMGGHAAGNVASNMAVQAFNKHISAHYPTDEMANILKESIDDANASIRETIVETTALKGMGCTMIAAILEQGKISWASVGDSHCYLIRDKKLKKLNADHSYGGFLDRMAAEGTPIEPEKGLSRNMLMSALTGGDINEVDVPEVPFELKAGDKIILCSDGLDTLTEKQIIQCVISSESPKACTDKLMQAVEDAKRHRQDNTTAVVVDITAQKNAIEEIEIRESAATPKKGTGRKVPASPPIVEQQDIRYRKRDKKSGGKALKIVGSAIVLLLIGVAVTFFMLQEQTDKPPPPVFAKKPVAEDSQKQEKVITEQMQADTEKPVSITQKKLQRDELKEDKTATKTIQDILKSGDKGPLMVLIPGGQFLMGSNSLIHAEETPRHQVTVEPFAISQYEITFAEYDLFAKASGRQLPDSGSFDRKTYPVIFVSWDDAYQYTKWLSEQTGKKYRLANEAEWEYMAATGKKSTFWWGYNEESRRAHCFGCGSPFNPRNPAPAGSFKPNAFGIYDTAGNVAEWVHDCWHDNYKGAPKYAEVWEGGDCTFRVARGGDYASPLSSLRNTKRDKFRSKQRYDNIGIRVVREIR